MSVPFIVYLWDIIKFLENSEPDAAAYVHKVSKSIRSYGMKDDKILKILHGEEFPLHSLVEKYFQNLPVDKIDKHIEWSEKIINPSYIEDFREFERQLQPDLANSNSRRILFIEALDEVVQKEVNKFYPEFFEVRNNDLYAKYDEILMEKVGELGSELDNFFFKNSKK